MQGSTSHKDYRVALRSNENFVVKLRGKKDMESLHLCLIWICYLKMKEELFWKLLLCHIHKVSVTLSLKNG